MLKYVVPAVLKGRHQDPHHVKTRRRSTHHATQDPEAFDAPEVLLKTQTR